MSVALAALFGSLASRRLVNTFSSHALIAVGCLIMLISSLGLLFAAIVGLINPAHQLVSIICILLPMMGLIFGSFGFVIPLTLSTALQKYQAMLGAAGALFGLSYYVLIAALTWIMGLIHNGMLLPMPIYFFVLSCSVVIVFYRLIKRNEAHEN